MKRLFPLLLLASAATAQPDPGDYNDPRAGHPIPPETEQALAAASINPDGPREVILSRLARSTTHDQEMASLVEDFYAMLPCTTVGDGICDAAEGILRSGGAPLAAYLGREIDRAEREGLSHQGAIPYIIGRIGAPACPYLQARADALRKEKDEKGEGFDQKRRNALIWTAEALEDTKSYCAKDAGPARAALRGNNGEGQVRD